MKGQDKSKQIIAEIWKLVEPVIVAEGMELVEVEYRRESQGWVLRLFIDQEDGITVADCTRMSQVIGDLLDVSELIDHPYHLEVSSPGLDRPLRKPKHFQKHVGAIVEIRTSVPAVPTQNRRRFKGILVDVTSDTVMVDCEGQNFEIPFVSLERARLCYFESQETQK
jgi:ribosome maturation factor RimP